MAVNYGILQTPQTFQGTTQVIQKPNYSQQNEQGLLSGLQAANEAERTATEKRVADTNIAAKQQEMDIAKQKLPGELQNQTLVNQGQGILNTKGQMDIASAKLQIQQKQDRIKAFEDAKLKGGTGAGLDAVENKFLDQGDTDSYLKMKENREKLQDRISKDDTAGLMRSASAIHGVVASATPDHPSLQIYTEQYPVIKKLDPTAPAPSTFKSDSQFQETYVHPVLATALPFQQQAAAQQKALMDNKLYQSHTMVTQSQDALKKAVATYGPNSQEALSAAKQLQQDQDKSRLEATGSNYFTSSIATPVRDLGRALNMPGTDSPEHLIEQNSKSTPAKVQAPKFTSAADLNAWYSAQSPEVKADIKANPEKYGIQK